MCCLTDFTASVTTAFSPMPTEPTTSHWPASSSACPQRRRAVTATAPKRVTQTKSGTLVLAAAGGWSPSRPSNPAASRGCGPARQSASTAHDQDILSPSPIAAPVRHRYLAGNADAQPVPALSAACHRKNAILQPHSAAPHQPKSLSRRSFTQRSRSKTTRRVDASH